MGHRMHPTTDRNGRRTNHNRRTAGAWAVRVLVPALVASLVVSVVGAGSTRAAEKNARDDRLNVDKTAWAYWYGQTPAQLSAQLAATGHRILSVTVNTPFPLTVDVVTIANSGDNATAWWWYPDLRQDQIGGTTSAQNARLTQLVPYQTPSGRRFFTVMIRNTGLYRSAWTYHIDVEETLLSGLRKGGFLPLAVEGRSDGRKIPGASGGEAPYENFETLITLANPEGLDWNLYRLQSPEDLGPRNGFRIIDVNVKKNTRLAFIEVESLFDDSASYSYTGLTPDELAAKVKTDDVRLIDLVRYVDQTRDPDDSPSETAEFLAATAVTAKGLDQHRLEVDLQRPPLDTSRATAMLRPARAASVPTLSIEPALGVEPASAIKALHVLHALRRVQSGKDGLSAPFTYYLSRGNFGFGHPNNCPNPQDEIPGNSVTISLRQALAMTLKHSDNRTTRGLELRYGRDAINATAAAAGLSGTRLNSVIGCFDRSAPNRFPAADAAALHAGVHRGTLLGGAARHEFYKAISSFGPGTATRALIEQEGAQLGLSPRTVSSFIQGVSFSAKGGSYGGGGEYTRSIAGRLVVPVRGSYFGPTTQAWAFALLVDSIEDGSCCIDLDAAMATAEADLLRPAFRQALRTYL